MLRSFQSFAAVLLIVIPVVLPDRSDARVPDIRDAGSAGAEQARIAGDERPGRVLVRFKAGTVHSKRKALRDAARVDRVLRRYRIVPDLQLVEVARGSEKEALEVFRRSDEVLYAEPDYEVHAYAIPNDPSFGQLWGLRNTGQTVDNDPGIAGADIRATQAWDIWTGDPDFRIAIIDTGVNYNHPDLAANMWTNEAEANGTAGVDDDGNGYIDDIHGYDTLWDDGDPADDHGHGSHVAGTIGAATNNNLGVSGINWQCKIVALKFLSAGGSGPTSDAIEALEYVVDNGIRISNNSWGSVYFTQSLYDAIEASQSIGHLFIAAAGNGDPFFGNPLNTDIFPHYPSSFDLPNVISVAAVNNDDNRASFTNYGRWSVDLGAPGVFVYSTILSEAYDYFSGTSMATPHVTGVASLLWSRRPELSWESVRDHVLLTARPIAALNGITVTGATLNALAAVGDCNGNGQLDELDVGAGSDDCNANGIPDECEVFDCNGNGNPDDCDLAIGADDCDGNGVPDACEPDCNINGITDACDIASFTSGDCNADDIPDECEPGGTADCNTNGVPDLCDIYEATSRDCNANDIPDDCDIAGGILNDADTDGIADECRFGFWLVPLSSTGTHTIDGDRIFLPSGGQQITFEIRMAGWDMDLNQDPTLRCYQAMPDPASFQNGLGDPLSFAFIPCNTSDDCRAGPTARGFCQSGKCTLPTSVYVDKTNTDYPFANLPSIAGTFDYEAAFGSGFAGALTSNPSDTVPERGGPAYAATMLLDVPTGAVGAYVVQLGRYLDSIEETFWCNETSETVSPPALYPAYVILPNDCNGNEVEDYDDIVNETSDDCNGNYIPDDCEPDCNGNSVADACDIEAGTSEDCLDDGVPDDCQTEPDCNTNGAWDENDICNGISADCNENDEPDECELAQGTAEDCNTNGTPDECDLSSGANQDCNNNAIPDECDIASALSDDCDADGVPDECQPDCNENLVADPCDISSGFSTDDLPTGGDGIPDECQFDCNGNGVPDAMEPDCNDNGVPDECDIEAGTSQDCDGNGIPNECEPDCNENGIADPCDIINGTTPDLNENGIPDECDPIAYVHPGATGTGDGSSWDDAFTDLQTALDAAANPANDITEVWVAAGTYRPGGGSMDPDAAFEPPDGLALYGGFSGGEVHVNQRDILANPTVLSCDLGQNDSGPFVGTEENCHTVMYIGNYVRDLRVDGFTITAGRGVPGHPNTRERVGGAVFCYGDVVFVNCRFEHNYAEFGGALYVSHSNDTEELALINCVLRNNESASDGSAIYSVPGNLRLINSLVLGNATDTRYGAILLTAGAAGRLVMINSAMVGNTSDSPGGNLHIAGSPQATLINNIFWRNRSNGIIDESAQIQIDSSELALALDYNVVDGWTGALGGLGNFGDDPLFVDAAGPDNVYGTLDDNLSLAPGSPCVDTGDDAALPLDAWDIDHDRDVAEPLPWDFAGRVRQIDGLGDGAFVVDRGPLEYGEDCNGNRVADEADVTLGASLDCNSNIIPDECEADCNGNLVPDDCDLADLTSPDCNENDRPDECDLADAILHDLNDNGTPDECECFSAPTALPDVIQEKCRYLSFSAGTPGRLHAVRVTLVDVPAPFDTYNGSTAWVGQPRLVSEIGGLSDDTPPTFQAATLQCTPEMVDFGSLGVVHVYHESIVPLGTYRIEVIDSQCDAGLSESYSTAVDIVGSDWGDLVGSFDGGTATWTGPDGSADIGSDVLAVFDKFRGVSTAPVKARTDLEPATPDQIINITDALQAIDAFRGLSYPFAPSGSPCTP